LCFYCFYHGNFPLLWIPCLLLMCRASDKLWNGVVFSMAFTLATAHCCG
jgi:hypothetical protein